MPGHSHGAMAFNDYLWAREYTVYVSYRRKDTIIDPDAPVLLA